MSEYRNRPDDPYAGHPNRQRASRDGLSGQGRARAGGKQRTGGQQRVDRSSQSQSRARSTQPGSYGTRSGYSEQPRPHRGQSSASVGARQPAGRSDPRRQSGYRASSSPRPRASNSAGAYRSTPRPSRQSIHLGDPVSREAPKSGWERSLDPRSVNNPPKLNTLTPLMKAAVVICIIVVLFIVIYAIRAVVLSMPQAEDTSQESTAATSVLPTVVSFVAVGDNLPEIEIAEYADSLAGETGDGDYDYSPIYSHVKSYIEDADLAYVDEEVHLGGDDIGPRGYPSFNTTDQMADALVGVGFDLVASATNHAYDWGFSAIEHSRSIWNSQPVAFTGTATSQEEADKIVTVERNGITFSLLSYTYGVNGYEEDEIEPYAVNYMSEDRIRADVARAKEASDVVIVAMHWGTENSMDVDETQEKYGQLLADLDVDLIVGSHPHTIGPVEWLTGQDGHKTLCAYSLGNFISNHEAPGPENQLEGMLSLDFVRDSSGKISIENAEWTPLVNHDEEGAYAVYPLKDYTYALALKNKGFDDLADPITWLKNATYQTVTTIPIND